MQICTVDQNLYSSEKKSITIVNRKKYFFRDKLKDGDGLQREREHRGGAGRRDMCHGV